MIERIEEERLRQGIELYADLYEQDEELQDLFDSLCISTHILYIPVVFPPALLTDIVFIDLIHMR